MSVLEKVRTYIKEYHMLENTESVIVGLSGGADSVCLIHLLWRLKEEFGIHLYAVHVNHGIRGEEAARDARFVRELCGRLEIPVEEFEYHVPEYAATHHLSEEEAGRELRYQSFRKVAKSQHNKVRIAVAHNAGDNAETFLHNLCRGSSLEGLAGIKPVNGDIIRPVLCLSRTEIETYLGEQKMEYITDSTNLSNDYTRNKIRNVIMPYLTEEINRHTETHISHAISDISEANEYLGSEISKQYEKLVMRREETLKLSASNLKGLPAILARGVIRLAISEISGKLKDITRTHIEDVLRLTDSQSGKWIELPYQITVKVEYGYLIFGKKSGTEDAQEIRPFRLTELQNACRAKFLDYEICTRKIDIKKGSYTQYLENLTKNLYTKAFDYDKIEKSVLVRTRKTGDYLTVNSEMGTKKLNRFLIDEKVSGDERDKIPLVADGSHIMWVVGYRMSEYYKISENTTHILEITICKKEYGNEREY